MRFFSNPRLLDMECLDGNRLRIANFHEWHISINMSIVLNPLFL